MFLQLNKRIVQDLKSKEMNADVSQSRTLLRSIYLEKHLL